MAKTIEFKCLLVQHCTEKHIKPNKYKLVRFKPRNSALKSFFCGNIEFFDTY